MKQVPAVVLLALLMVGGLSRSAGAAPVRVAYMYCDWPEGSAAFRDEFDQAFAALGWQVTKFENKQAKALSDQLGDFDIVVGGGVSNLSNPQDFKFMGTGQSTTGLLQNAMALAKTSQHGLQVLSVAKTEPTLGRNQVTIRLRNILEQPAQVGARLSLTGKAPLPPVHIEQMLPGKSEGELSLDYNVSIRGEQLGTLELLKDGQVLLSIPHQLTVPELVTVLTAHTNEKDLGQQELGAPALPATGKADVMFEDRSVDVVDGKIQDAFAPYAVHVYRLRL